MAMHLGADIYTSEFPHQELELRVDASALVEHAVDFSAEVADVLGQRATMLSVQEIVMRS